MTLEEADNILNTEDLLMSSEGLKDFASISKERSESLSALREESRNLLNSDISSDHNTSESIGQKTYDDELGKFLNLKLKEEQELDKSSNEPYNKLFSMDGLEENKVLVSGMGSFNFNSGLRIDSETVIMSKSYLDSNESIPESLSQKDIIREELEKELREDEEDDSSVKDFIDMTILKTSLKKIGSQKSSLEIVDMSKNKAVDKHEDVADDVKDIELGKAKPNSKSGKDKDPINQTDSKE